MGLEKKVRAGRNSTNGDYEHEGLRRGGGEIAGTALLAVGSRELAAEAERVAAAIGIPILRITELPSRRLWARALLIIIDMAMAERCVETELPARSAIWIVADSQRDAQQRLSAETWRAGMTLRAQRIFLLPDEGSEMVKALSAALSPQNQSVGVVITVIGACGGVGTSTLAVALGSAAPRATGLVSLIVDTDVWSGGLDLLTGHEDAPGVRWPDISLGEGSCPISQLMESAVVLEPSVSLLSTVAGFKPSASDVHNVVESARSSGCAVVVDTPGDFSDSVVGALEISDLVVVCTPLRVAAAAAARCRCDELERLDCCAVIATHGPAEYGLNAGALSEAIGVPLGAELPTFRRPHRLAGEETLSRVRQRDFLQASCDIWELTGR